MSIVIPWTIACRPNREEDVNLRLCAVALGAALSACAIAPQPHFDVESAFEPERLDLSASDTIAFLVTVQPDPNEFEVFGGSPANAVTLGFRSGFLKAHPDVRLVISDEALTKACFDSGTKSADPSGTVIIDPDLSTGLCTNLVKERAIRYLVSIGAKKLMRVVSSSSSGPYAETEAMHRFKVIARVTDTKSGAVVCSGEATEQATSTGILVFVIPLVWYVDQAPWWEHTARRVGDRLGSCFVQRHD